MKKIIKKIGNRLLPFINKTKTANRSYPIDNKTDLLNNFYQILKKIKFHPVHIIDVGANSGTWTREIIKYFPNAYYTLLEPQEWLKESIKDLLESNPKISFNIMGAGRVPGNMKFTLAHRDDSSSFRFSESEAIEQGLKQIEVPVVTLNEFIGNLSLPVPDIIKIDAEGFDLEVLKGATNYFGKTEIFLVEAAVVCKEIDNSLTNVVKFMDDNGYNLFEITDMNRTASEKTLWLVELVFVKKNGFIDSIKFTYN